jgi:hypothetical protein
MRFPDPSRTVRFHDDASSSRIPDSSRTVRYHDDLSGRTAGKGEDAEIVESGVGRLFQKLFLFVNDTDDVIRFRSFAGWFGDSAFGAGSIASSLSFRLRYPTSPLLPFSMPPVQVVPRTPH